MKKCDVICDYFFLKQIFEIFNQMLKRDFIFYVLPSNSSNLTLYNISKSVSPLWASAAWGQVRGCGVVWALCWGPGQVRGWRDTVAVGQGTSTPVSLGGPPPASGYCFCVFLLVSRLFWTCGGLALSLGWGRVEASLINYLQHPMTNLHTHYALDSGVDAIASSTLLVLQQFFLEL